MGIFVEQELLTHPEHMSSPPVFSGVRVTRSLVLCVCFVDSSLSFCLFLLAIVLSVLLRFTYSDYSFGIFKLFLSFFYCRLKTVSYSRCCTGYSNGGSKPDCPYGMYIYFCSYIICRNSVFSWGITQLIKMVRYQPAKI